MDKGIIKKWFLTLTNIFITIRSFNTKIDKIYCSKPFLITYYAVDYQIYYQIKIRLIQEINSFSI